MHQSYQDTPTYYEEFFKPADGKKVVAGITEPRILLDPSGVGKLRLTKGEGNCIIAINKDACTKSQAVKG